MEGYAAEIAYVKKSVRNHRCNSLGTEAHKRLSYISDVNQAENKDYEEECTGETPWHTDNCGIMHAVTPKGKA